MRCRNRSVARLRRLSRRACSKASARTAQRRTRDRCRSLQARSPPRLRPGISPLHASATDQPPARCPHYDALRTPSVPDSINIRICRIGGAFLSSEGSASSLCERVVPRVTNSEAGRQQWAGFGSCDHGITASWEVNRPPLVVGAAMGSVTSRPWGVNSPEEYRGSTWVTPVAVSASAYSLGEAHSNRVPANCRNWNWWPKSGIVCTAAAGFPVRSRIVRASPCVVVHPIALALPTMNAKGPGDRSAGGRATGWRVWESRAWNWNPVSPAAALVQMIHDPARIGAVSYTHLTLPT